MIFTKNDEYIHNIIRFIIESQIKFETFLVNKEDKKNINSCLNYIINKLLLKKKIRRPFRKKKLCEIIESNISKFINLEIMFNPENKNHLQKNILLNLNNILKIL